MKKYLLILLVACSIILSTAPAFAKGGSSESPPGPPGWSHVNPGTGGTGPGSGNGSGSGG